MPFSDSEFLANLSNPVYASYRGRGFFWSDIRLAVPSDDVYYYLFRFPALLHTVIYGRNLSAGEGPVAMDLLFGATYDDPSGTLDPPINLFLGKPASQTVVYNGITGVSGGIESKVDHLFSAGNNSAVAGSGGQPTIFPPGVELLVRITNNSLSANPGIQLQLAWVEQTIPNDL